MSSKTIFVCIFCSLIMNVSAGEVRRSTIQLTYSAGTTEEFVRENFSQLGISSDESSQILIHKEENYIDLTCFNCIVRHVDSEARISAPFNEASSK